MRRTIVGSTEEHYGRWMSAFREDDPGVQRSFDDLASGLASGTISRRRALKLTGAALLGSSGLLALFPGMAGAQGTVGETALNVMVVGRGGCKEGEPAIGNNSCRANQCGDRDGLCFCATTVDGRKRCVNLRDAVCPKRDECDRNRDCPGDRICIRSAGCCGHLRRNDCVKPC